MRIEIPDSPGIEAEGYKAVIPSYHEDRETYLNRIEAEGYKVVIPKGHELQIDLDGPDAYAAHESRYADFLRLIAEFGLGWEPKRVMTGSKSGLPGHSHVTITLYGHERLGKHERIMWQAILGSDPMREMLSAFRVETGQKWPVLFAEKQS